MASRHKGAFFQIGSGGCLPSAATLGTGRFPFRASRKKERAPARPYHRSQRLQVVFPLASPRRMLGDVPEVRVRFQLPFQLHLDHGVARIRRSCRQILENQAILLLDKFYLLAGG